MNKIGLFVPTLNAGKKWEKWLEALAVQTLQPDFLLLIDSSSSDGTARLARQHGFAVQTIAKTDFNHGGTRQQAVNLLADADIVVFLTQDALLANPDALARLLASFDNNQIAAVYGRQLPHHDATAIAAHARLFNYPAQNQLRSLADTVTYGIKTIFISNSFAAFRRSALLEVGGFPSHTIMNEDTYVAGKLLLAGWKVAYCADAQVHHSHNYGFMDEFKRYFDIGVFHAHTVWLQQTFGGASGEGLRFVKSELRYLANHAPLLIPSALTRTGLKWLGFRLGSLHAALPQTLNKYCSLHKNYWGRA